MWLTLLFIATASLFWSWALFAVWHLRWVRRLPRLPELPAANATGAVRCSIVVAARDEEARIEQTIRRLLTLQGVQAEIIVVDDRSTDGTPDILRRLADEDPRIQTHRVDTLPEGWLGKCHACHVGARAATGDWILFTDADCWLKPDVVERAVRVADRDGAGHVTLISGLAAGSPGLRTSHLMFLITLSNWISGVNRDQPKAYLGIGAFNLVRAAVYRQCGGYETLRLTVLDDMRLGLLVRRAGQRTRGFLGGDDVECHWGTSAWGMVKIMEKNYFAAIDYRSGMVWTSGLFMILFGSILVLGVWSGTLAGWAAALSPLSLILPAMILARRLGWPWTTALGAPAMMALFFYALFNSAVVTLRQGGIRWRDTFYPLAVLRAGNVR